MGRLRIAFFFIFTTLLMGADQSGCVPAKSGGGVDRDVTYAPNSSGCTVAALYSFTGSFPLWDTSGVFGCPSGCRVQGAGLPGYSQMNQAVYETLLPFSWGRSCHVEHSADSVACGIETLSNGRGRYSCLDTAFSDLTAGSSQATFSCSYWCVPRTSREAYLLSGVVVTGYGLGSSGADVACDSGFEIQDLGSPSSWPASFHCTFQVDSSDKSKGRVSCANTTPGDAYSAATYPLKCVPSASGPS